MQRPRILISLGNAPAHGQAYSEAITAAGGEAILLPAATADLSYDGLLLGGEETDNAWKEAEVALTRSYIDYGRPVFGICRGAQLLNAALGGSLWPCLGMAAAHYAAAGDLLHPACARKDSLLWDLYDSHFTVNSCHRQALRGAGCGILPTAWAADGIVEGFEHERLPLFGVQWHPERCLAGEGGCAPGLPLFRYFLCLCREGGEDLHPPVQRDPDVRFACGLIDPE